MITYLFSCPVCGLVDVEVVVPPRSKEQDLMKWIQKKVLPRVAIRHSEVSLLCEGGRSQSLKIPHDTEDPEGWIGKQTGIVAPISMPLRGTEENSESTGDDKIGDGKITKSREAETP